MCGFRNKKHLKKIKGTYYANTSDKSDQGTVEDSPSLLLDEQPEYNVSPILEEKNSESTSTGHAYKKPVALYYCSTCGKKFSKKPYAKNHCCKAQKVFKCGKCGLEIKHASNVGRHEKKCLGKQTASMAQKNVVSLTCGDCGKHFSKLSNLSRHKQILHGVAEEKILKCLVNGCSFATNDPKQLKKHKTMLHESHSSPFCCDQCDLTCITASGLRYHKASVHGFRCRFCAKPFSSVVKLATHTRIVHNSAYQTTEAANSVIVRRNIGEHATVVTPAEN